MGPGFSHGMEEMACLCSMMFWPWMEDWRLLTHVCGTWTQLYTQQGTPWCDCLTGHSSMASSFRRLRVLKVQVPREKVPGRINHLLWPCSRSLFFTPTTFYCQECCTGVPGSEAETHLPLTENCMGRAAWRMENAPSQKCADYHAVQASQQLVGCSSVTGGETAPTVSHATWDSMQHKRKGFLLFARVLEVPPSLFISCPWCKASHSTSKYILNKWVHCFSLYSNTAYEEEVENETTKMFNLMLLSVHHSSRHSMVQLLSVPLFYGWGTPSQRIWMPLSKAHRLS